MNTIEAKLKNSLMAAVSRRRQQKRVLNSVYSMCLVVAAILLLINQDFRLNRLTEDESPVLYEVVRSNVSPLRSTADVSLEYVSETAAVETIETVPLALTIVTDSELESTFSDRAYALSHDSEERITAFHLLDDPAL